MVVHSIFSCSKLLDSDNELTTVHSNNEPSISSYELIRGDEKSDKMKRSSSPFLFDADREPALLPNGFDPNTGKCRINRIRLCTEVICSVSHVTSPSCLWIKPINHITKKLQVTDCSDLEKEPKIEIDEYVMAPVDDGVYGRARILDFVTYSFNEVMVHVVSIDSGATHWYSSKCLAKMKEASAFHPWQAIKSCLFSISPRSDGIFEEKDKWSEQEILGLRQILERFSFFRAEPILDSSEPNDTSYAHKIMLFGLKSEHDHSGTSINHLFARMFHETVQFVRNMKDAALQRVYLHDEGVCDADLVSKLEKWRLNFPASPLSNLNNAKIELYDQIGRVEMMNIEWLNQNGYCWNGRYYMHVEGRHIVSPHEFYARPLKYEGGDELHAMEVMLEANAEIRKFADGLNDFYGLPANRKHIDLSRIERNLAEGISSYGIVEVENDYEAFYTGQWQRVRILDVYESQAISERNLFCHVLFIDSGGVTTKLISNVIEIHQNHCAQPAFCLRLCINELMPVGSHRWTDDAIYCFHHELRDDVPISVIIRKPSISQDTHEISGYDSTNTVYVGDVKVWGAPETLDELMIHNGHAVKLGDIDIRSVNA